MAALERSVRPTSSTPASGAWRVAITGASGLVGSYLVSDLQASGHLPLRLVRRDPGDGEIFWDPERGEVELERLEGLDAVVHLAGESLASGPWTAARKAAIMDSRRKGTEILSRALARLEAPPKVLVSASAIGYYGAHGDEPLDESSPPGTDFLAEVCRAWEAATEPARDAGVRVVNLRIGMILAGHGGALPRMLPPFRMGLGGPLGDGRQVMSWVALEDVIGAIRHAIRTEGLSGPLNATAPHPATNAEFTRTLGRVLGRPAFVPVPAAAIRLMFGEMGKSLLLAGARVLPRRLLESGYAFQYPDLEAALRHALGRS